MRARSLLVAAVLGVAACGGGTDRADDGNGPPGEVTGVIVAIKDEGSDVESFTLESDGGRYEIAIAADVDYGFDLAHLHEHRAERLPVTCTLEERDGQLVALEILDAPAQ